MLEKVVLIVVGAAIPVAMIAYLRSCFAASRSRIQAFDPVLSSLALRHGLTFSPTEVRGPRLFRLVTPPKAAGVIGHVAVEVSVESDELNRHSYLRFTPQVRVHGWPRIALGFQLRDVPAAGRESLAQIEALGYRAYMDPLGLTLRLDGGLRPFRQKLDIDTNPERLQRALDLGVALAHSYPPVG